MSDVEQVVAEQEQGENGGGTEEKTKEFDVTSCTCKSVVVFLDRAEVCRSLKANLEKGENEVFVTGMSSFMDEDSIRVEGKGNATITEVAYQTRALTPQEQSQNKTKVEELNQILKELRKKENVLGTKLARFQKQRTVLDNFADSVSKSGEKNKNGGGGSSFGVGISPDSLQWIQGFFDVFDEKAANLDDAVFGVEQELQVLREEINAQTQNLYKLQSAPFDKEARVLSILLEASEDGEVELNVSYVVSNASWSPKYDIRVFSDDKKLKVCYYGVIKQSTGEDWEDTKLSLSTAMPSVGGTVPELSTVKIGFKPKIQFDREPVMRSKRMKGFGMNAAPPPPPLLGESAYSNAMDLLEMAPAPVMAAATAEVRESVTSAVFEIARQTSIPADNTDHKVSVALIDLEPDFQYQCVPKLSTFAYLTAKVKNTSQYALLAGPSNIFLDNNFVAKASLKAVSPGEEFECSLGIDQSIKVTYKPLHKFHEKSGLWSKVHTTTYRQVIELHNKHKDKVDILVSDQLPQSTEEKVKVNLLEPVIKTSDKTPQNVKINKHHNVEWTIVIPGGKQTQLVLKYSVEHPAGEEVSTTEVSNFDN